jgi:drug/metabolite transporter (DMT)-like permease
LLKLVREEHIPDGQVMLISGLSGMGFIFFFTVFRGNVRRLQPQKWGGLLAIGISQWIAFFCWINALPYLPLTSMYVVAFLTPMTVACLATLVLKEPLGWQRAFPIALGFAGVVVAVNPVNLIQTGSPLLPYVSVFGSMIGSATQMLLLRAVGHKMHGECMAFYPRMVLVSAGLFLCATTGFVAMKPWVVVSLCGSGVMGSIGWVLMSKAYKNAPAAAVAPFQYAQMLMGALLGFLIWGDFPNRYLIMGATIIIASGIYLVRHERRVSRTMIRAE